MRPDPADQRRRGRFDRCVRDRSLRERLPAEIIAFATPGLSYGLTESVNTKLRLRTRIAFVFVFESTDIVIALCLLDRGGRCRPYPGERDPRKHQESPKCDRGHRAQLDREFCLTMSNSGT